MISFRNIVREFSEIVPEIFGFLLFPGTHEIACKNISVDSRMRVVCEVQKAIPNPLILYFVRNIKADKSLSEKMNQTLKSVIGFSNHKSVQEIYFSVSDFYRQSFVFYNV